MKNEERIHRLVEKHAELKRLPADQREAAVAELDRPWIGHEGPLGAKFFRADGPCELLLRGIAFADDVTVSWDEAGVRVLRIQDGKKDDHLAIATDVHIRQRFLGQAPPKLERVDFLIDGAYQGSHYRVTKEGDHA